MYCPPLVHSALRCCKTPPVIHRNPIYVSAVRHFPKTPIKFPVVLHIKFPPLDEPEPLKFFSYKDISDFLSTNTFLRGPDSKNIRYRNVKDVDPTKAYEIIGPGFVHTEKWLPRDQVWDEVFEEKSKSALMVKLQKDDPGVVELPGKICDAADKDVAEWEGIFQLSDGCMVFLESKYRMSLSHVDKQANRIAKSLLALGKPTNDVKLYLAGCHWHDDPSTLSFASQKGYGIIQPNGEDWDILDSPDAGQ